MSISTRHFRSKLRLAPMRLSWEPCELCGGNVDNPDRDAALAAVLRAADAHSPGQRETARALNRRKAERYAVGCHLVCYDCWLREIAIEEGRATRRPDKGKALASPTAVSSQQYNGAGGSETLNRFREADDLEKRGIT